jgi:Caspase domain
MKNIFLSACLFFTHLNLNLFGQNDDYFRKKEELKTLFGRAKPGAEISTDVYAVFVGIGDYPCKSPLKYAASDALALHKRLDSVIPAENTLLLLDWEATYAAVVEALRETCRKAGPDDVVLFYISSHGVSDAFLTVDYDGKGAGLLQHADIEQIMRQCKSRHKIIIADACFSAGPDWGESIAAKGINRIDMQRFYRVFQHARPGFAYLLSCSSNQYSFEDASLQHGIFTWFLLKALNGAADQNRDGLVSILETANYVKKRVDAYTKREQTPVLLGEFDAGLPLTIIGH